MFAIPFGRILWLEYRAQRALWFSFLLIGLVFQGIVWGLVFEKYGTIWSLIEGVLFLPVFYALGCGAMLFANERENHRSDWMLCLSIPPVSTLTAKYTFAVASTLFLQFGLAATALALMWKSGIVKRDIAGPGLMVWDILPLMLPPFGLLALAWSSLGSLISRRVSTSVLATAICCIFANLLLFYVVGLSQQQGYDVTPAFVSYAMWLALLVFAADLWIGYRWCRGRYFDGELLEQLLLRRAANETSTEVFVRVRSSAPIRPEYRRPSQRMWQRLLWQERHRESFDLKLVAAGCLLWMLFGLSCGFKLGSQRLGALSFFVIGIIFLAPMAIGVFGFRPDAQRSEPRYFSQKGISPYALWLAKHAVWLPRAVWVPSIAFIVSLYLERAFFKQTIDFSPPLQGLLAIFWQRPDFIVWFIVLSYGSGQMSAMLFQRAVLSFAVAGMLNFLIAYWMSTVETFGIAAWCSLGLPAAAIYSTTLWQMRAWVDEDLSSKRQWSLCAALAAAPALVVIAVAWNRITEVRVPDHVGLYRLGHDAFVTDLFAKMPEVRPQPLSDDEQFVREQLETLSESGHVYDGGGTKEEIREILKREFEYLSSNRNQPAAHRDPVPGAELIGNWAASTTAGQIGPMSFDDQFTGSQFYYAQKNHSNYDPAAADEVVQLMRRDLKSLNTQMDLKLSTNDSSSGAFHACWLELGGASGAGMVEANWWNLTGHLLNRAAQQARAGNLDQALECQLASLKLARVGSKYGSLYGAWTMGSAAQLATLEKAVGWASCAAQTPQSIRAAIQAIKTELEQFPSAKEAIAISYLKDHQRFAELSADQVINEIWTHSRYGEYSTTALIMQTAPSRLPWERKRLERLMALEAETKIATIAELEERLSANQFVSRELYETPNVTKALARTTFLSRYVELFLSRSTYPVLQRETMIRAALTRMELMAYRIEHGKLPERLVELMATLDGKYLVDPWSNRLFDYYPSFLLASGRDDACLMPASATELIVNRAGDHPPATRLRYQDLANGSVQMTRLDRDTSMAVFPIPPVSDVPKQP